MLRPALPLLVLATALPATAPAAPLDLPALIECRQGVADYAQLDPLLADPLKAVAQGLQPLPQTNAFMREYRTAQPITVFGQRTDHIAVAGASLMAVLDQADPHPLATTLKLETGYDQGGKFMAGRELVSRDVTDPKTGEAQVESVILSVSTVTSHPGKTLAGCTYSLDLPPDEPAPAAPAPAATPGH
ncbi:hypothetical protein [Stenotrophomonas sp. 24(2023)]|uniref:hypothetical protein n=1 Tax=Stenotrophomonas sp. 24(2023) TaxID=3068324 RepID=UPI0027DECA15|nr:hypothetical protein [Stenotrophomonas sp. 24(2023)]WMJ71502.1 hypothetical protein Q9R17_15455 [Stenotrophomonas sp. 24(2023)]